MLLYSHKPEPKSLRNLELLMNMWGMFCNLVLQGSKVGVFIAPAALHSHGSGVGRHQLILGWVRGDPHGVKASSTRRALGAQGKVLTLLCLQAYHREEPTETRARAV